MILLSDGSSLQADEVYHVVLFTHQKDLSIRDHLGSIYPDFYRKPNVFTSVVEVDNLIMIKIKPISENSDEGILKC